MYYRKPWAYLAWDRVMIPRSQVRTQITDSVFEPEPSYILKSSAAMEDGM